MASTIDFRNLDEGFGGKTYKRKRFEQAVAASDESHRAGDDLSLSMDVDPPSSTKRQAVSSAANPDKPASLKVSTYEGGSVIAGRVSGRCWKQPRKHRSSALKVSVKGTPYEVRAQQKEVKRAYRERMNELKEEIRNNKIEKRKKKEEREKRRQENILKSGTKFQKITNPKTLQKIAKSKQRKQLKVVHDDLLKK
uniref:Coiled-coil domain-containing protein 86 n=1 Tax=Kalanchoe fedtschenkoi TaxID=63787 RepID=A0A7N1A524_KALFE